MKQLKNGEKSGRNKSGHLDESNGRAIPRFNTQLLSPSIYSKEKHTIFISWD
jgi:hypothetical protein